MNLPDNGLQLNNNVSNNDGIKGEYENNYEANSLSKTNGENHINARFLKFCCEHLK